jgi:hypothetical protein
VKKLGANLKSEGDADFNKGLRDYHRYCITPDRLYDVVRHRVLFRRHRHGVHSSSYELLHWPRQMVVQENIEVVEKREEAVYATVTSAHNYRVVMEPTTDKRPGKITKEVSERMHVIKLVSDRHFMVPLCGGWGGSAPCSS